MKQHETRACRETAGCICQGGSCTLHFDSMNYEERRQVPAALRGSRQLYDAELQHYYFYQLQLGQKIR